MRMTIKDLMSSEDGDPLSWFILDQSQLLKKGQRLPILSHSHLPMILGLTVIHTVCAFPGPYVPKMYMIHNEHMTRGSYVPSSVVKNIVVLMHNDSEYLKGLMRCAATGLGWNGNGRSVVWILYIWGKWTGKDKRIQTCPICKCRYTLVLTKGANVTQIRHLKDQL